MIGNRVHAQLLGSYSVAQFHVRASFQAGFLLVVVSACNVLGFLVAERLPRAMRVRGAALAAGLLVLLAPGLAHAARLEVGGGGYPTIGAAVAAAADRDQIVVHAGVYHEHLVLSRPLALAGDPGAVVDGDESGTVIRVEQGPARIQGLTIRGSGTSLLGEDAAIRLEGAPGSTIEDNRIDDVLFGILVISSPHARVLGNQVRGKDIIIPRRGDGIRIYDSGHSLVEGNAVTRSRDFAIWESNDVTSRRNHVSRSRYGLHFMYCDDNLFEDNVFENNQVGAAITYSRRLTLRRNRFTGSRGPSAYGLLIKVGDDVLAEGNWFLDDSRGIFLEDSPSALRASVTIRRNVVAGNDVGVSFQSSVARVLFTENVFAANAVQAELLGRGKGENVWSAGGRGNYWSDYVGYDADGDGIGDSPFTVEQYFEHLVNRWPAVGLLRMSPAAEALEMGARAFPIVKPDPALVDEHPLMEPPPIAGAPAAPPARPGLVLGGLAALGLSLAALGRARRAGGAA